MEYVAVFQRIVMPIAYAFNPELVLISVDFDEIGNLSTDSFGYLIHWLCALANGKVIIFTEGDRKNAIASCMKTLLGDPLPMLKGQIDAKISNIETIQNVISAQQTHWKSLKFNKLLPALNEVGN